MVSGVTFRSPFHFGFVLARGVRTLSTVLLLRAAVQLPQHHIVNMLSFPLVYSCQFCPRLMDNITVGLFLGFLGGWLHVSTCLLVCARTTLLVMYRFLAYQEIRDCDSSLCVLPPQDCFGFLGTLVISCSF